MSRLRVIVRVAAAVSLVVVGGALRPLPATSAASDPPPVPLEWLALGDSYSSGEGVFDDAGDCQRSSNAWANAAARTVAEEDYLADMTDLLACTGAQTTDAGESVDFDEQLVRAGEEDGYPIVTYTIGGNDIGFVDIVRNCMGFDDDIWKDWPIGHGCDVGEEEIDERVRKLESGLNETYGQVADLVQRAGGHVVVLGYPILLEDPAQWADGGLPHTCELIQRDDAPMLRRVGMRLNDAIRQTTERWPNFHYVDVAPGFEGHSLCSDAQAEDEWINGISLDVQGWGSVLPNIDKSDSMHPNYYGHAYEGRLVADTVAGLDWSELANSGTEGSGQPLDPAAGSYAWYVKAPRFCLGEEYACTRATWHGTLTLRDGTAGGSPISGTGNLDGVRSEVLSRSGLACVTEGGFVNVDQSISVAGEWTDTGVDLRFEPGAAEPLVSQGCQAEADELRQLTGALEHHVEREAFAVSTNRAESWVEVHGEIYRVALMTCENRYDSPCGNLIAPVEPDTVR